MKSKHATLGLTLVAGLLLAGITHADTAATAPLDQNNITALRQCVTELTAKNDSLQAQVTQLKHQLQSHQWQTTETTHEYYSPTPPLPPGAVPHLFNGGIYYTIPVNARKP